MLSSDFAGQPYNKAAHNRDLQTWIDRNRSSIEFKHQNISAVQPGRHRWAGQRLHRRTGLLSSLPKVDWLLWDRGYDADWFRGALKNNRICACIPNRKQRKSPVKYEKRRYKRRIRIEIIFGWLKDWRRVATRHDRCPKLFLAAIALAATDVYWL